MPLRRLHLVVDHDLGPALWAREETTAGRSRAAIELRPDPVPAGPAARTLHELLASAPSPLRHRVAVPRGDGEVRRLPAWPLDPEQLQALVTGTREAVLSRLAERSGVAEPSEETLIGFLSELLSEGTAVRLAEDLIAMPDLLAGVIADLGARDLVATRRIAPVLSERFDGTIARWQPLEDPDRPLLSALVDIHARAALAEHLPEDPEEAVDSDAEQAPPPDADTEFEGDARTVDTSAPDTSPDTDAVGRDLLAALGPERAVLDLGIPARRRLENAIDRFLASGRRRVRLASSEYDLVVRLFEPPLGAAWPLQTCLREHDGTVHPVADLRAVGDLSAEGAAEAAGEVMRLAPTIRTATLDDTGVDWLLTTSEASAVLTLDTAALEAAGVTVLLPRDWTKTRTTVRGEVTDEAPAERTGSGVGLAAMASFRWKVAVGDVELSEQELEEIRSAQSELVHLRGQWIRLDADTLRAAERFLDAFRARARNSADGDAAGGTGSGAGSRAVGPRTPASGAPSTVPAGLTPHGPGQVSGDPGPDDGAHLRGQLSWGEILALVASDVGGGVGIALTGEATSGEAPGLADLFATEQPAPAIDPPLGLKATLRPYQQRGLDWMWFLHERGLGGVLADDMGLGKTMQVLALLCTEREQAERQGAPRPGPTLLICPMSVVGAWQREAERFAPDLAVHVHHGGDRVRDESFVEGAEQMDLVITTYALLGRDLQVLRSVPWSRLVLDEAQHVKNPATTVTRAARALPAPHRLALTGTPVENRLGDLHSLMEAVNPGLLGSAKTFQEVIASPIEQEGDDTAVSRLKMLTGPFVLRRVKTDRTIIADLPEKTEITQSVNLTPEQAGLYEALVNELMAQIDGASDMQRRGMVVSTLTKLKQVCNHPAHFLGDGSALMRDGEHRSGKLERVDDLLEAAIGEGDKVLLFTQFTSFGRLLLPHWQERLGITVPFLHGGVSKKERDQMVAEFQEHPEEPGAMLLSLKAGGTGLTLTAANHVVHIDRWWNPAVEDQATDRAFRIGQRKDVQVRKLVSAGTVEERIDQVLSEKSELADLAVGTGEGWIADLGPQALWNLLNLDEDEVSDS